MLNGYIAAKSFFDMRFKIKPKELIKVPDGEFAALNYISVHEGMANSCDMARAMNISSARAAVILKGMLKKGYIKKSADTEDKRKIVIVITEKGKEYIDKRCDEYYNKLAVIFDKLGEKDSDDYLRLTEKIIEIFNNQF